MRIVVAVALLLTLSGTGRAQTNVAFDATSGSSTITTPYTTAGGLTISLGFFGDYLVVGGGGASGGTYPGGGGGGQVLSGSGVRLTSATNTVVVGGGGAWANTSGSAASGGSSSFLGATASGGGGGNGGTGAGGTSGSGNTGGTRASGYSGGGGGQTARGSSGNSTTPIAGNGGAGVNSTITGSTLMYGFGGSGGSAAATGASAQNGDGTITNPRADSGGGGRRVSGTTPGNAGTGRGAAGIVILRYAGSDATGVTGGTAVTGTGSNAGFMLQQFTTTGTISGTSTLAIDFAARLAATLTGTISGSSGGMTFNGPGTLTLAADNAYTGATTVAAGRLAVNGALGESAVMVLGGAELGGSGSIGGSVSVAGGGTLAPGNSIASLATGTATFAGGATFAYEIDSTNPSSLGAAADLLVVNGGLNLDPANGTILTVTDLAGAPGTFPETTSFALINYSGAWNGGLFTYAGNVLADGSVFTVGTQEWEIDYDRLSSDGLANFTADYLPSGAFVAFTAVPEPATCAMALAGLACGGFPLWRRRKRTRRASADRS